MCSGSADDGAGVQLTIVIAFEGQICEEPFRQNTMTVRDVVEEVTGGEARAARPATLAGSMAWDTLSGQLFIPGSLPVSRTDVLADESGAISNG